MYHFLLLYWIYCLIIDRSPLLGFIAPGYFFDCGLLHRGYPTVRISRYSPFLGDYAAAADCIDGLNWLAFATLCWCRISSISFAGGVLPRRAQVFRLLGGTTPLSAGPHSFSEVTDPSSSC